MRRKPPFWGVLAVLTVLIWTLLPLFWALRLSFETMGEIAQFPPLIFPPNPQPGAYFNILGLPYVTDTGTVLAPSGQASQILLGIRNSFIVAVVVTVITLAVVIPLAYVFARLEFRFKNALFTTVLLATALPPVSTLIPFYALYIQLGLVGTLTGLLIVNLTITIPFVSWMLVGYFRALPRIEPLAQIDGFSRLYFLFFIFVPMARSGIAVCGVIAFLFSWNEYVYAQVLVTGSAAVTLPAAMSGFLFMIPQPAHLAAALGLTIVPPLLVSYFLQRHVSEMNILDPVR